MTTPHASCATIERLIIGKAVDHLLQRFPSLSVETGDQTKLLVRSDDVDAVLAAACSDSDDGEIWLFTPERAHFVKLVPGNGVCVISDFHVDLDRYLAPANNLARALEA